MQRHYGDIGLTRSLPFAIFFLCEKRLKFPGGRLVTNRHFQFHPNIGNCGLSIGRLLDNIKSWFSKPVCEPSRICTNHHFLDSNETGHCSLMQTVTRSFQSPSCAKVGLSYVLIIQDVWQPYFSTSWNLTAKMALWIIFQKSGKCPRKLATGVKSCWKYPKTHAIHFFHCLRLFFKKKDSPQNSRNSSDGDNITEFGNMCLLCCDCYSHISCYIFPQIL